MQPHYICRNIRFIKPKAKKSIGLLDKIIDVSLNVSSLNASDILKNGIADVGKSTICNLLKKNTPQTDKETVTKVYIDDFAFKKRYTYGTIMIDIETRRIIDLLPSREIEDVAEWLSSLPNLEIVSRDGSVPYHSAIKQANEKIAQISDRFHLLKGLTDAAKKVITSLIAANIGIPLSASHYEGKETTDYWDKEIKKQDFPTREHNVNYEKKKKAVEKVLELTSQGWKRSNIATELALSYSTVKMYQSPNFSPVHGLYNTTKTVR